MLRIWFCRNPCPRNPFFQKHCFRMRFCIDVEHGTRWILMAHQESEHQMCANSSSLKDWDADDSHGNAGWARP